MTVKALKKQLMAAIAMVVVALIALSSSTYAWFAANSNVKANMASITATSDAAFLEISKTKTGDTITWNNLTSVDFNSDSSLELLPARFKATSLTKFETAFAASPTASTILDGSAKDVSAENLNKYVWKETVYIRAQSGTYQNLSVSGLLIENAGNETSGLISAGRVLAVCGDKYQIYSANSTKVAGDDYLYTDTFTGTSYVTVDLYFYYDGDDSNVYTDNFSALKAIKASITFNALQASN